MIRLNTTSHDVEHNLRGKLIGCPDCDHKLTPWGHDRPRMIRNSLHDRRRVTHIRRRRARCTHCHKTHIIQDPRLVNGHKDTARVIRHALTLRRHNQGYRKAADQLDRPESTVRNWYRKQQTNPKWPCQ